MQLYISEILDKASKAKTKDEKIKILRENATPALKEVIKYAFGNIEFYTNSIPSYKIDDAPYGLSFSSLYSEYKRLYIFTKDNQTKPERKTQILLQILESIHPSEADLLYKIVTKTYKPNLNKKIIEEAFPGLLV